MSCSIHIQSSKVILEIPNWNILHDFAAIFPMLSVLVSWTFYYYYERYPEQGLQTISETVIYFPENRIFSATMNIESLILLIVFYLRVNITEEISKLKKIRSFNLRLRLTIMKLSMLPACISLSVLSAVTLEDHFGVHIAASGFFFLLCIIFFICSDLTAHELHFPLKKVSIAVTAAIPVFMVAYPSFLCSKKRTFRTLGGFFQYCMCFFIFIKIYLFQYDYPNETPLHDE